MVRTAVSDKFIHLFHHDLQDEELENSNHLNLFILKISNNSFCYDDLLEHLYDAIITFSLSRHQLDQLRDSPGRKYIRAIEKFRKYSVNEGELGELLLYCFLETHKKAPKILTKLEIKTSKDHYVKGADGVHLLKLDDKNYQLILGESKLDSDLQQGIYDAFGSITKFIEDPGNKLGFELNLVNSQLLKEAVDDDTYDVLKKIIIPSAKDEDFYLDKSFGIFLGFDISVSDEERKMNNRDFRDKIRARIKEEVIKLKKSINFQLRKSLLHGYSFYIYVLPFEDLPNKRKELIEKLIKP